MRVLHEYDSFLVRDYDPDEDRDDCERVFAELGEWFGIPSAVQAYLARMAEQTTFVAESELRIVGFVSVTRHFKRAAEIDVLAVAPELHRQGIGRTLVGAVEDWCRRERIGWLQVKTLDEGRESAEYDATRRFWRASGFAPLQTFAELWDPSNPALQMVKSVPAHTAASLITSLELQPHPEGGFYRETWRAPQRVHSESHDDKRNAGTSVLFLLGTNDESSWHRVTSDEVWLWHSGDPVVLTIRDNPFAEERAHTLGWDASFQAIVPAGAWQKAKPLPGAHGFALVGCVVAPGFEFRDFRMGMVDLRPVQDGDLDAFFAFGQEPDAVRQAAFTAPDPTDRAAFDAHWQRIRAHDGVTLRSIDVEGTLVGHIASFVRGDEREVTYWLGQQFWGKGFATMALDAFLDLEPARPLYARVAADNDASLRVLTKCGFTVCRHERGFAEARGEEIDEIVLVLEGNRAP